MSFNVIAKSVVVEGHLICVRAKLQGEGAWSYEVVVRNRSGAIVMRAPDGHTPPKQTPEVAIASGVKEGGACIDEIAACVQEAHS